ncbi:MAG: hypothetical protein ACRDFS_12155 [Chloroflexota bacterium]
MEARGPHRYQPIALRAALVYGRFMRNILAPAALLVAMTGASAALAKPVTLGGARVSSSQLELPLSAFPAGFLPLSTDRPMTAAAADDPAVSWLTYAHTDSTSKYCGQTSLYRSLNMGGGYYQDANQTLSDQTSFVLAYLGTYYSDAAQADSAFHALTASEVTAADLCGNAPLEYEPCDDAQLCSEISLPGVYQNSNGFPYVMVVRTALTADSVFEGAYLLSEQQYAVMGDTGENYLGDLEAAWQEAVSPLAATPSGTNSTPAPATPVAGTSTATATVSPTVATTITPPPTRRINYRMPASVWPSGWTVIRRFVPTIDDSFLRRIHGTEGLSDMVQGQGYEEQAVASAGVYQARCRRGCPRTIRQKLRIFYAVSVYKSPAEARATYRLGRRGRRPLRQGLRLGESRYATQRWTKKDVSGRLGFRRGTTVADLEIRIDPRPDLTDFKAGMRLLGELGVWIDGRAQT